MSSTAESPELPLLQVVSGEPDAAELAALSAVIVALMNSDRADPEGRPRVWGDPEMTLGVKTRVRDDGWRASGLPRRT